MGDPERYRSSAEVKKWQEDDPIGVYHRYLLEQKITTEAELDDIDQRVVQEVQAAVQFAESSPEPALETLFDNIYADH
jgi:pyruvate dehydrogenase E1 component alpha subunit